MNVGCVRTPDCALDHCANCDARIRYKGAAWERDAVAKQVEYLSVDGPDSDWETGYDAAISDVLQILDDREMKYA